MSAFVTGQAHCQGKMECFNPPSLSNPSMTLDPFRPHALHRRKELRSEVRCASIIGNPAKDCFALRYHSDIMVIFYERSDGWRDK